MTGSRICPFQQGSSCSLLQVVNWNLEAYEDLAGLYDDEGPVLWDIVVPHSGQAKAMEHWLG